MFKNLLPTIWRRSDSPAQRTDDHPFFALQREMNQVFDGFFRGVDRLPFGSESPFGGFSPSIDVQEGEKEVRVKAELPGMDEKDVDVTLSEGSLTIQGEKKEEREDKRKGYWQREAAYGSFQRVIPLPEELDREKAEARFKNGVLTVTLPWREGARTKGKKIAIKAE